jgi:hypothetical protein
MQDTMTIARVFGGHLVWCADSDRHVAPLLAVTQRGLGRGALW